MIDQELLIKSVKAQLDENEQHLLDSWLNDSGENRAYYQKIKEAYSDDTDHASLDDISVDHAFDQMLGRVNQKEVDRRPIYQWAAAVILLISAIFVFTLMPDNSKETHPVIASKAGERSDKAYLIIDDEKVVLGEESVINMNKPNVVIASNNTQLSYQPKETNAAGISEVHSLVVPRGGQYQVMLSDGSKVWLNADSQLNYPEVFDMEERLVELSGEAYFEVTHDPKRPFRVKSGNQTVSVLGTAFNVSAYANEGNIATTLVEGSVQVDIIDQGAFLLEPGTQLNNGANDVSQRAVDVNLFTSWKDGLFVFHEEPLYAIMNKLSRWYDIKVEYRNATVRGEKINGEISKFDHIEPIIDILQETGVASFKLENETIVIY